jgi:hypothetical protein
LIDYASPWLTVEGTLIAYNGLREGNITLLGHHRRRSGCDCHDDRRVAQLRSAIDADAVEQYFAELSDTDLLDAPW